MYYPYVPQYREQQHSRVMTVTGNASLSVEPNVVMVQLEVVTDNKELKVAQQENTNTINQVIQSLMQLGIPRDNIQTASYNIYPKYDYVDGKQVFRGYEVSHALNVTINDINQAGAVIDAAVQNGVNRVSNIEFTVDDKDKYYRQALSAALENAMDKAETLAETMQVNLDPYPMKIVEKFNEPPAAFQTFATAEKSSSTTIEPGQIVIVANVTAQFQYYA
ncbi:SIMPL domain-containing protein [Virgibacillus ndiopensis]|uniref:SIMPL domain-containing protein n=1 Tax=Virgibacillus ndiopensis TaxID=2004408 RepID=UPI000C074B42|nr:SIMPL domain-containing protein [Virgibacillus ndiopensis]